MKGGVGVERKALISKVLSEDLSEIIQSTEELESALDEELSKPENETDYDLIDQLITGILESRDILPAKADIKVQRKKMEEMNRKSFSCTKPKWLIGASVACFMIICGNIYTVSAWKMDMFSFIVTYTQGGAVIDFQNKESLPVADDDPYGIIDTCREAGIETETPHYIPDGFVLKEANNECVDDYKCMVFHFKNRKSSISLVLQSWSDDMPIGIPSDEHNISETTVNGHVAAVSKEDNQMLVVFRSGDYLVSVFTEGVDYDECDKILENIW